MPETRTIWIDSWAEWEVVQVRDNAVYVRVLGRDREHQLVELRLRLMIDQEDQLLEQLVKRWRARNPRPTSAATGGPPAAGAERVGTEEA